VKPGNLVKYKNSSYREAVGLVLKVHASLAFPNSKFVTVLWCEKSSEKVYEATEIETEIEIIEKKLDN